jgi:hypothetical protein
MRAPKHRKGNQLIYLASSWRNTERLNALKEALEENGWDLYDFRANDDNGSAFHWSDLGPNIQKGSGYVSETQAEQFIEMIKHPIAINGHKRDMDNLDRADCLILVLPCGKSAHAEFGMAVKSPTTKTIVYITDPVQPELLYASADHITSTISGVLRCLKFEALTS